MPNKYAVRAIDVGFGNTQFITGILKEEIADAFPHHEIKIACDPVFANVRDFQRAEEHGSDPVANSKCE